MICCWLKGNLGIGKMEHSSGDCSWPRASIELFPTAKVEQGVKFIQGFEAKETASSSCLGCSRDARLKRINGSGWYIPPGDQGGRLGGRFL